MGLTLAIDFDQTVHDKAHPVPGRRMGPPLADAPAAMDKLLHKGYTLIIHTTMATTPGGTKAVEDWLKYYGIKHHGVTAIKPNATFFIDDKAIHHVDWETTMQQLKVRTKQ